MFYRAVVAPKKPAVFVPPPEEHMLHLSQAALPHDVKEGTRASLLVRFDPNEEPAVLCTLCAGRLDTVALDQFFSHYCEFSVAGNATIHLSGYYAPQHEEDDEGMEGAMDEDEEDDDYMGHMGHMMADDEDEDEDEDESDEDDEDESDDDDEGFGFGAPAGRGKKPSVVIEDITDHKDHQEQANGKALKALPAPGGKPGHTPAAKPAGKQQQQQQQQQEEEDDDDSEEDESEDDEGESEDDEGEEDESEEEEEKPQAKAGDKRKSAAEATPAAKKQAVGQQQAAAAKTPQQQQKPQAADKTPAKQQQAAAAAKTPQQPAKTPQQPAKTPQPAAKTPQQAAAAATPASAGKPGKPRMFENGFEIHDVKMGQPDGRVARAGKRVSMRYVGRLKKNGKVFDSNTKGKPFQFRLGVGEVIKGWDRGVEGMRVGDKRKLVIPPQMAYGSQSLPGIPPNSVLEFDVELVDVK